MALAPFLAKQTSTTTGTGTLTLLAAATNFRSFNAALGGSSIVIRYSIRGSTYFEEGIGTYDGGSPGTLTRSTVLASSNSGNLVSLPAGTHDVFVTGVPGIRGLSTGSGADTLALEDLGNVYEWSGTANTLTLPAAATWPADIGTIIRNAGSGILTIDADGSETINGITTATLYPGQTVELFRRGSNWRADGAFGTPPQYRTGTVVFTAGAVAVTLSPAFPNGFLSVKAWPSGSSAAGTFYPISQGSGWSTTGGNLHTDSGYGGGGTYEAWGY